MGRQGLVQTAGQVVAAIALCEAVGFAGSRFTAATVESWYPTLAMPSFAPPPWVFAPVWTALYAMMGVAAFLVWRRGTQDPAVRRALLVFGLQLVLNFLWSPAFFGLQSPAAGLAVIVPLWGAILWTTISFFALSRVAGALLLPYLGWVSFAVLLNAAIVVLNR